MFWSIVFHSQCASAPGQHASAPTGRTLIEALELVAPGADWAMLEPSRPSRGQQATAAANESATSISMNAAAEASFRFLELVKQRKAAGLSVWDIGGTDQRDHEGIQDDDLEGAGCGESSGEKYWRLGNGGTDYYFMIVLV